MGGEFKGYFHCLRENTEKYFTFSVPIKKVIDNVNDNDNDSDSDNDNDKDKNKVKTITYRLKFIDSYRFIQDSLSNLVDNFSGIDNKKPENKLTDNMRSMTIHYHSLLIKYQRSIEKYCKLMKKNQNINS